MRRSKDPEKVRLILQIIVGARRPLKVVEIALALGVATETTSVKVSDVMLDPKVLPNTIRSCCGLFVFFNHSRAYLIHQTAKEFLLRTTLTTTGNFRWSLDLSSTQEILANICIKYLAMEDMTPNVQQNAEQSGALALLNYAKAYWPEHFADTSSSGQVQLYDIVLRFYDTADDLYQTWNRGISDWAVHGLEHRISDDFKEELCPAYFAAKYGHLKILKKLLRMEQTRQNTNLSWALIVAAARGHEAIVRYILLRKCSLYDDFGPLEPSGVSWENRVWDTLQIFFGREEHAPTSWKTDRLISKLDRRSHRKYPLTRSFYFCWRQICVRDAANLALSHAANAGRYSMAELLLTSSHDMIIMSPTSFGYSPLEEAAGNGHLDTMRLLLDHGASVDTIKHSSDDEPNALISAVITGQQACAQLLIDRGAEVNAHYRNYDGLIVTALQEATE